MSLRTVERVKVERVTNDANSQLAALLADEKLLTMPEVADKLLAYRDAEGKRWVPEAFFNEKDAVSKYVSGCITVLADGGYTDDEILVHLFTEDESLPGRPIDGLHGHLAREVIRRAQASAF